METVKGFDSKKRAESVGLCWMEVFSKTEKAGGSEKCGESSPLKLNKILWNLVVKYNMCKC